MPSPERRTPAGVAVSHRRYADVPAAWADNFKPQTFTYKMTGGTGGTPREWNGSGAWKDVEIEGDRDVLSHFLALEDVRLTDFSLLSSEAEARLAIRNPFAFDLKIAESDYRSRWRAGVGGEARGDDRPRRQRNLLDLPIELDTGELISLRVRLVAADEVGTASRPTGRPPEGGDLVVPLNLRAA